MLVFVALVALLAPRNSWFVFDRPVVLTSTATAVSTLLCGVYTASAITGFGWDAGVLARSAKTLTDGDQLTAEQLDYFARFPNNVPFLCVELIVGRVAGLVGLPVVAALVLLQIALVALIVWCLGRTAWVLGRPGRIVPVQGAGLLLIGLSPQVSVPYTDLPGAACVAVAVTAMASAVAPDAPMDRYTWAAGATASLAAGVMFKPYVAVVLIALVLVGVVVVCAARCWAMARRAGVALTSSSSTPPRRSMTRRRGGRCCGTRFATRSRNAPWRTTRTSLPPRLPGYGVTAPPGPPPTSSTHRIRSAL